MQADLIAKKAWQVWLERQLDRFIPRDPGVRHRLRVQIFRVIAVTNIVLGLYYFLFRYTSTINMNALWIALPLLIAETYAFIDSLLFIFMMWRPQLRETPPALENVTVEVFITTYSEDIPLVRETAEAALKIRYPHKTYVLDDGNRPEMRQICEEIGCGYITRGDEWKNRPRHAKAGNVNNALTHTTAEFILILDADQIAEPEILDRTLGYFADPRIAFVQTPQYFYNVPLGDPFGSQAPLFYGPIQQGKDGWNAAFFCGSNAVLRREALFHLGLVKYVNETEKNLKEALSKLPLERPEIARKFRPAAYKVSQAAERAVNAIRAGHVIAEVLDEFNAAVRAVQRELVAGDVAQISRDLLALETMAVDEEERTRFRALRTEVETSLITVSDEIAPAVTMLGIDESLAKLLRLDRGEALDVQPLVTFSITEDMATAMNLHALGWQSVFHSEILAKGLAPEDLGSALGQRLRWGAGTIQVMLFDNPLTKPGLSLPQRIQYATTMYSYFSGFASLVFLAAPIIYLFTGIAPVTSYAGEFLIRIIPYLLINRVLFMFVAWGISVFRGEQYNLALFPLWIRAVITVFSGEKLTFNVTPKTRQSGVFLNLVMPQLTVVVLLIMSSLYALFGIWAGWRNDAFGVMINILWAFYDIWMLSVILKAAVYKPPVPTSE